MQFVKFVITNQNGKELEPIMLEQRKADIMIEKVYNMGNTSILIID